MQKSGIILILTMQVLLSACAIKVPVQHYYKLNAHSCKRISDKPTSTSILVTHPTAVSGYQTEKMRYIIKPFELSSYANNAWVGTPAALMFPLMTQSLQYSGYFSAVSASPYADQTNYRLDTQLIELHQNFLSKPSVVELAIKAVLSNSDKNRVVASRLFTLKVPCPQETFYGGVVAANRAANLFTLQLTDFVINHIKKDRKTSGTIAKNPKKLYNVSPLKSAGPGRNS